MNWDTKLEEIAAPIKYPIGDGDHGSIKPDVYQDHGVPYIRVADIKWDGSIDRSKMVYIPEEVNNANPKSFLYPGDILISKTGATIGKVAIIPDSIPIANTTASIGKVTLDLEKAHPRFVFWCMKSQPFQGQMWSVSHKSAQPGFNVKDLKSFQIPLPPLETQKKIASILDAADAYRQKTKALIEKYDELTQSLFLEMFGDPVRNEKGFRKIVATDYYEVRGRVGWKGYKKTDLRQEGAIVLGATHITNSGELDLTKVVYLSEEKFEESPEIVIKKNDLIFVQRGNTIGKVGLVREDLGDATINPVVLIFRPQNANPLFLLYLLMNKGLNREFVNSNAGSAQPMITQKFMKEFMFIDVPIDLQNQFAKRIQEIEAQKAQAQQSLEQAEELFNSLLQRAFKGELV